MDEGPLASTRSTTGELASPPHDLLVRDALRVLSDSVPLLLPQGSPGQEVQGALADLRPRPWLKRRTARKYTVTMSIAHLVNYLIKYSKRGTHFSTT